MDYEIVSLEETAALASGELPWFRYVIGNGVNFIEGVRSGTREEVFDHATRCAERLNTRHKIPVRW